MFADLGLVFNTSTFYYVYRTGRRSTGTVGLGVPRYVVDTSDEEAFGVEVDSRWQPVEALTLTANAAWIDATIKEKIGVVDGEPSTSPANRRANRTSRRRLARATSGRLATAASSTCRRCMPTGARRAATSSRRPGRAARARTSNIDEATNRTDVRLAWANAQDRWGVAAYMTNVFDNRYVEGVNNLTRDTFGTPFAMISEPRIWGAVLRGSV